MGSFSTSFAVYGATPPTTNTFSTGYSDTNHKLCDLTVEGCRIIIDPFSHAQQENCEDTAGLSISPSLYGGDGTLAVTYSNSVSNRAFRIRINMSWVDKDEDCPETPEEDPCSGGNTCLEAEIYGDPHITTFDGKTYLL